MTALLFTDSLFMTSVLQINTEAFESEYQLAVILLKLVSMDFLQSPVDVSAISSEYVFTNFFSILEENKPVDDLTFLSIRIPHSLFSRSEDLRLSTLYEIAYAHLSTYLKCISDSQFLNLKDIIKKHLTSDIPTVSLLISDTVMYRLRCSSTEYLCTYCISFAENWSQIDTSINMQIFLKRMLKFLPFHEKKKVFGKKSGTLQILEMDSHKLQHRYGIPELSQSPPESIFDPNEQICLLMRHTEGPFPNDIQRKNEKYCKLLELCALFVNIAQCAVLLKFTEFASHMFKSEVFEVQMAVLTFVKAWKKKNISSAEPQFEETLKNFAMLVAETLCCKNYIVQNEAVSTCVTLFKFNPQIRIMKEILGIPSATVLKSHIAAIPLHSFLSEKEQNKNFQTQLSLFKDLLSASSKS
ncbi:uncharacterized protein LOC118196935 isoform X2 [Stegodyphus dumicola]|nr:uncharacterized protein LOC118196935 isoform X2 [Stegodyphus dumicola]